MFRAIQTTYGYCGFIDAIGQLQLGQIFAIEEKTKDCPPNMNKITTSFAPPKQKNLILGYNESPMRYPVPKHKNFFRPLLKFNEDGEVFLTELQEREAQVIANANELPFGKQFIFLEHDISVNLFISSSECVHETPELFPFASFVTRVISEQLGCNPLIPDEPVEIVSIAGTQIGLLVRGKFYSNFSVSRTVAIDSFPLLLGEQVGMACDFSVECEEESLFNTHTSLYLNCIRVGPGGTYIAFRCTDPTNGICHYPRLTRSQAKNIEERMNYKKLDLSVDNDKYAFQELKNSGTHSLMKHAIPFLKTSPDESSFRVVSELEPPIVFLRTSTIYISSRNFDLTYFHDSCCFGADLLSKTITNIHTNTILNYSKAAAFVPFENIHRELNTDLINLIWSFVCDGFAVDLLK
jgi:hypothetical protein